MVILFIYLFFELYGYLLSCLVNISIMRIVSDWFGRVFDSKQVKK
jgi:hypothetical protein